MCYCVEVQNYIPNLFFVVLWYWYNCSCLPCVVVYYSGCIFAHSHPVLYDSVHCSFVQPCSRVFVRFCDCRFFTFHISWLYIFCLNCIIFHCKLLILFVTMSCNCSDIINQLKQQQAVDSSRSRSPVKKNPKGKVSKKLTI